MENNQTDSFVIYRLPFEEKTHLIKGKCETSLKSLASLKGNNFVISPFNHGQKVIYIPFREEEDFNENELLPFNYIKLQNPTENREKKYNEIINLAKDQMKNGNLTKVVLTIF